jgi:hypothetical protein
MFEKPKEGGRQGVGRTRLGRNEYLTSVGVMCVAGAVERGQGNERAREGVTEKSRVQKGDFWERSALFIRCG